MLAAIVAPTSSAAPATTERVSIDSGSGGGRELPAMSADADRVIFVGRGESNQGVWLRDRSDAQTYRLTTGSHFNPAISADGTTIAYVEYGSERSVWVMDITDPEATGTPERVDLADGADGAPGNGLSDFPSLDDDGNVVAFQSTATNLTPTTPLPSSGGPTKVYVRDLVADTTVMVSVDADGTALPGNAVKPDITPDARFVVFASEQVLVGAAPAAASLPIEAPGAPGVPSGGEEEEAETETFQQVYVHDLTTGDVTLASANDAGEPGNGAAALTYGPTISDDGRQVAFESDASNLAPFDSNGRTDAFARDLTSRTTVRVSERSPFEQFGPFTAVTPVRLIDTRDANDPLGVGEVITVPVLGTNGVPATATAAAFNVTIVSTTGNGYVTVFPTGEAIPLASNLNVEPGDVVANAVTAKIGADGSISVFSNSGGVHVIVDLAGYYDGTVSVSDEGGGFTAIAPTRVLDTRVLDVPLEQGEARTLAVAGIGDVPSTATAVALNVTAVTPTTSGYLTVFPNDEAIPLASNVNFVAGQVVPNSVLVKLGADGSIRIFNSSGTTHVVVDVFGYFDPGARNGGLTPVTPARLLDTRTAADPLAAGETIDLEVVGVGGVPDAGATTVVLNVTAVTPTASGFLTAFPAGIERPLVSNLNFVAGDIRPNQVVVAVGDGGKVSLFNSFGDTHVVVDVAGWFSGVQVFEGGLGPAITGDGDGVAFESLASTLTAGDTNGVKDAFIRILDTDLIERVSVPIAGGTEATGTRTDGHTGELVPVVNGVDVNVGTTVNHVAFVSNGNLTADRVVGEETEGEISTEPASFMRSR